MAKSRKCPDCSAKMSIRKSSKGEGSKFWGCTAFPDCKKTIPYFGDGAKAGCDIDLRQITNGFILRATPKYVEDVDADIPDEIFIKEEQIEVVLTEVLNREVKKMIDQIQGQIAGGFDKDEENESKKASSPVNTTASDQPATGGKDIKRLLMKAKSATAAES